LSGAGKSGEDILFFQNQGLFPGLIPKITDTPVCGFDADFREMDFKEATTSLF
jgi:hypothetical protein